MATTASSSTGEVSHKHLALAGGNNHAPKNSLLPIFRLPPEILENIFLYGARNFHESNARLILRVPRWVNISYVCRRWRDVALSSPILWSYHFTLSQRWTEELLARSKPASLKIHILWDSERTRTWWIGLVEKLLNHAERIQILRLCVPFAILPKLSLRTPRLQILHIQVHPESNHSSERCLTIDGRDILPLRTLKLAECPLPWHTLNLSGLTTLFLRRVPAPKQNPLEFLATLDRIRGLTTLHLDRALASARGFLSSGTLDISSKINLPCLARLFVVAPLSTVIMFLSRVNIPLKTQVRLDFEHEDGSSAADYAQLPLFLAQRFTQSQDLSFFGPTVRSLGIRYLMSESAFTLCTSGHNNCNPYVPIADPQWNSDVSLVICVQMGPLMMGSNWDHIATDIFCSIPLTAVESLHVSNPPRSPNFWSKMLSHFRGLQCMRLSEGYMPNLVSLLTLTADEPLETPERRIIGSDRDPSPAPVFVPALRDLELYGIVFAAEDDESEDTVSEKSLQDALATRGVHRPRLTTVACHVEDDESDTEDDNFYTDDDDDDESYIEEDESDTGDEAYSDEFH